MSRKTWLLLALIPAAFAAGWLLRAVLFDRDGPHPPSSADATAKTAQADARLQDTLARLRGQLAQTEKAREQLAERVAELETRPAALDTQPATGAEPAAGEPDAHTPPVAPAYRTTAEALVAAGIPEEQAALIQQRLDASDLTKLYLEDRARREGWFGTPQYQVKERELQDAVRELRPDIGEDAYDRLLYTLRRANRVMVRDVIQFSPAEQADLRPGDRIVEYAGQRVFTIQELQTLTHEGTAGAQVLVRVNRAGELLNIYVPRGPLGIHPAPLLEAP